MEPYDQVISTTRTIYSSTQLRELHKYFLLNFSTFFNHCSLTFSEKTPSFKFKKRDERSMSQLTIYRPLICHLKDKKTNKFCGLPYVILTTKDKAGT